MKESLLIAETVLKEAVDFFWENGSNGFFPQSSETTFWAPRLIKKNDDLNVAEDLIFRAKDLDSSEGGAQLRGNQFTM